MATKPRTPKPEAPAPNIESHTGTAVHAGIWTWNMYDRVWVARQACGLRANAIAYGYPTTGSVTCKRCVGRKA